MEKTVIAHSSCWRTQPPGPARAVDERTRARHAAVHDLLGEGVGLLECARRLGWALNTVKRYARAPTAGQLQRPPRYGRTLVDPYRDHLRRLAQGRAHTDRAAPPPRRLVSWIMTRPADLPENERGHLQDLLASCPHLSILAEHIRAFADLLTRRCGTDLESWMSAVEASDLPGLHGFVRGLRKDLPAVVAGSSLPYSNGPIEGADTKVKLLKRQMYGRAGFPLLRKRILLS